MCPVLNFNNIPQVRTEFIYVERTTDGETDGHTLRSEGAFYDLRERAKRCVY
jgi:hypothetical protein